MNKLFVKTLKMLNANAQFAIRKTTRNGVTEYLPMVKAQGLFNDWLPIVKVYDEFIAMPYEKPGGLTEAECEQHIAQYREQISREKKKAEFTVEYVPTIGSGNSEL